MQLSLRPVQAWWYFLAALLLVCFATTSVSASEAKTFRVGQVFIVGNHETPAYFFYPFLPWRGGDVIRTSEISRAEEWLRFCRLWLNPRVTLLPPVDDSRYTDVLVSIEERDYNWLFFNVGFNLLLYRCTGDFKTLGYAVQRLNDKCQESLFPKH